MTARSGNRRCAIAVVLAMAALTPPARAHLVTTGLGPVYDGIGHLFLTLEDLLPAMGLALLAGFRGAPAGRCVLFALPAAWLVGGWAGVMAPFTLPAFPWASFMIVGILLAADVRLAPTAMTALAIVIGLIHGFSNGTAMKAIGGGFLELVGITAALFVLVALVAGTVVAWRAQWARIAVRVVGSWIAAIGLLLLGWLVRSAR